MEIVTQVSLLEARMKLRNVNLEVDQIEKVADKFVCYLIMSFSSADSSNVIIFDEPVFASKLIIIFSNDSASFGPTVED